MTQLTQDNANSQPPQQYSILQNWETVREGDEFDVTDSFGWWPCHSTVGQTVRKNIADNSAYRAFRRPLPIMEGYRYLEAGETIKATDEFRSSKISNNWHDAPAVGQCLWTSNVGLYRRKLETPKPAVDPGEGYRLLQDDEVIREGDEFNADPNSGLYSWCPDTTDIGYTVRQRQAFSHMGNDRLTWRRKLEPTKVQDETDKDEGFCSISVTNCPFMMRNPDPAFFKQRVKICTAPNGDDFEWETEDADAHSNTYFETLDDCMADIRDAGFTGEVVITSKLFDK